jgi:hypothetical protein
VPDERVLGGVGNGMQVGQDVMTFGRWGIAALGVGVMKRSAQLLVRYARRRRIVTGRLLDNPATLERLSDLTAATSVCEALVQRVAALLDAGVEVPAELYAACKASVPELAFQAVDTLLQGLGGRGYEETSGVPQLFRDTRLLRVFEGPTETMLLYLGASGLQRKTTVSQLLRVPFGANELADQVEDVLAPLRTPGPASVPDFQARQQEHLRAWYAGQVLTAAVLRAAAEAWRATDPLAGNAGVAWAREHYERAVRQASAAPKSLAAGLAEEVLRRVAAYQSDIGDVEQQLAGEETERDELLCREEPQE